MNTHETQSPLERLQQLINLERDDIGTLIAYGVGIGLLSLATPVAVQALVNTIAFGALFQPLLVLTLVLLVLISFSNTLVALQFYVVEKLQRRLFVRLFGDIALRLQQAQIAIRDDHYLPELANRFFDVVTLQKTTAVLLLETLGYALQTLIGMLLLGFYHPLLLAFDLFLITVLALILFVMSKNGVKTAIIESKTKYAAAAWLENIATNPLLGKSASDRAFLKARTERIALDYLEACIQHFRILNRQNISALALHTIASTLLLGMGGWLVIDHQLSLGQLIAAELVVSAMIYGLTRLGKTLETYYTLLVSVDKIGHLLDLPQEATHGMTLNVNNKPYQVDIYGISLPESPYLDVLRSFDLHLAAGESLVISQGSNRGSLLDVLFGLRTPNAGYVCLDNHDLRDLNLGLLRDTVSLVRDAEQIEASILVLNLSCKCYSRS
jgi:ABC-type bacteriocin/lantibiotic exporter with double-glycine peptidase domain